MNTEVNGVIRIVAMADLHITADGKPAYVPLEDLEQALEASAQLGDILFVAGDLTHKGSLEGMQQAVSLLREHASMHTVTVDGNHEDAGDVERLRRVREKEGIRVIDNSTYIFPVKGWRIGVTGFNGCLTREDYLRGLDFATEEDRVAFYHRITEERYVEPLIRNLSELRGARVDAIVVMVHAPIVPGTLCDPHVYAHDVVETMTSKVSTILDEFGVDLAITAHVHDHQNTNTAWSGYPEAQTSGGTPVLSPAVPMLYARGENLFLQFDLIPGKK